MKECQDCNWASSHFANRNTYYRQN